MAKSSSCFESLQMLTNMSINTCLQLNRWMTTCSKWISLIEYVCLLRTRVIYHITIKRSCIANYEHFTYNKVKHFLSLIINITCLRYQCIVHKIYVYVQFNHSCWEGQLNALPVHKINSLHIFIIHVYMFQLIDSEKKV